MCYRHRWGAVKVILITALPAGRGTDKAGVQAGGTDTILKHTIYKPTQTVLQIHFCLLRYKTDSPC